MKQPPSPQPPPLVGSRMLVVIWSLFFARWFLPAEGTADGGTLGLVPLTFLTAAAWSWSQYIADRSRLYRDRWDRVVWWLVIAHVASAAIVVVTVGQKRLAANMFWEWSAVGMQFFLLRQTLTTACRRVAFLKTSVVLWTVLAGHGIWQHFVWYPSNVALYQSQRAELEELEQSRPADAQAAVRTASRMDAIRRDFVAQGVPLSGPQRGLFERRLRDSKEPIAFFALANSLGGMLATVVVLWVAWLCEMRPGSQRSKRRLVLGVAAVLLVSGCLLLTKSRSALVGCGAGVSSLFVLLLVRRSGDARNLLKVAGLLALGLLLLVPTIVWLGGLDLEVLSESSKSLKYRIEYWTATLEIIRAHPVLGVGPGNFRAAYQQHKLPGASEDIADPHSFVLDVLANAGLFGGLALLSVLGLFVWTVFIKLRSSTEAVSAELPAAELKRQALAPGPVEDVPAAQSVVMAIVALAIGQWALQNFVDLPLLCVGALAAVAVKVAERFSSSDRSPLSDVSVPAVVAAALALLVHLLGAGGIASPAIVGWLLALFALLSLAQVDDATSPQVIEHGPRFFYWAAVGHVLVGLLALMQGWLPVMQSKAFLMDGDIELSVGHLARANSSYNAARDADALSPEALRNLAQVAFLKWTQTGNEDEFGMAIEMAKAARERDPFSGSMSREVGVWFTQRFDRTRASDDALQAVFWLEDALRRYPTQPLWNAEYAMALQVSRRTDDARKAARRALELDELNRAAGHLDRYLPEPTAARLRKL